VIECALGDHKGKAPLYCKSPGSGENSLVRRCGLEQTVEVSVMTLDEVVRKTGVLEPFFVKIDVQGYEHSVLRGARETIAGMCTLISEFWPWGLKTAGASPNEYLELLNAHGYRAFELDGRRVSQKKIERLCEFGQDDPFVVTDLLFRKCT